MYFLHIIQFSFFCLISSPSSIDPHELTGCLCIVGSVYPGIYMQAPAPQGPGFPKQEPSVNAITVFSSHPSIIFLIISLD